MKKILIYLIFSIVCISIIQCDKLETDPEVENLKVDLIVLDASDNEVMEFNFPETDFRLMLKVSNESDSEIIFENYSPCPFFKDKSFLTIYTQEDNILVGRPFPDDIPCATLNYNLKIPANDFVYLAGGRWLDNPDNSLLPIGKYYSECTLSIQGNDYPLSASFEVK